MLAYVYLVVGLVVLLAGGEWLVRGASGLAHRFEVSPLIVGLTIVAFGTSAPELLISIDAALLGEPDLAVGNVVGSNIANVLLVLGVPALIGSVVCRQANIGKTLIFLALLTALLVFLLHDRMLSRTDGAILFGSILVFLFLQYRASLKENGITDEDHSHDDSGRVIAILLLVGVVALPLGAFLTVEGAKLIAARLGVSTGIIGLTIVALGTSLPELATSVSAVMRKKASVAIGNVVGSNLFNISAIIGATALIQPLSVGPHIMDFDIWVMVATTTALLAMVVAGAVLSRPAGVVLSLAYVAYLAATVKF